MEERTRVYRCNGGEGSVGSVSVNEEGIRAKVYVGVYEEGWARARDGRHDGRTRPNRIRVAQRKTRLARSATRVRSIERIVRSTTTDGPDAEGWVRAGQATMGDTSRDARRPRAVII